MLPHPFLAAEVKIFSTDERGRAAAIRAYREFEALSGQRFLVTAGLSSLTMPHEWLLDDRCIAILNYLHPMFPDDIPLNMRHDLISSIRTRHEQFMYNIKYYGERSIHSKSFIKHYLDENKTKILTMMNDGDTSGTG